MNVPSNLVEELKDYLKQQTKKGDLEAKILLAQLEQVPPSPSKITQQPMDTTPYEQAGLGC
jgi:exonuclease V gamma subunit